MTEELIVSDDWTKNWQASIAVKITALVLWVIIVVVFIAAAYFLKNLESRLHAEYEAKADRLAYQIADLWTNHPGAAGSPVFAERIARLQKDSDFPAVSLESGAREVYVGQDAENLIAIERRLPVKMDDSGTVVLRVFHRHLDHLVETRRNQLVIAIFSVLLVFGLFLTWSIRTIVHRPLQQLVNATRAISEGQRDVRLDVSREDEFGYLSRFFNQMLDRLMGQQHELELAAEEARSASRAKSAFLANMSHELRTPLNAIIGYSEMLREDVQDAGMEELTPDLDKINAAGRHLLSLINDVLDLSKIEAGKIEIEPVIFQVEDTVRDVVDTVQPMLNRNGNRLDLKMNCRESRLFTDETKLRQILVNLMSNAAKFTEQGVVTLDVNRFRKGGQDWIEFAVRDTGIGIDPAKIDQLFKDFSQIDSTSTRKYSGSGLGLAISCRFCRKLGGSISVQSEPGKGSVFTARLPVDYSTVATETAPGTETLSAPAVPGAGDKSPPTVLIVDRDPLVRELISRFLSAEGYRVLLADTQERAGEIAGQEVPDVIILDAALCQQDGCSLYRYLQTDAVLSRVPVVLLSEDAEMPRAKLAGAAGCLGKPVDRDELLRVIGNAPGAEGGKTALVVDDNASSRDLLARTLQGQGMTVIEACDGEQALTLMQSTFPAVIFTDLILPNMNGFDLIKSVRKQSALQALPVVVVTAMDLNDLDRSELESERAMILEKGVDLKRKVVKTLEHFSLL